MQTSREADLSFDRVAGIYEATRYIPADRLREVARILVDDAGLDPGAPFLDAGVGTGRFARNLRAEGAAVMGADISAGMLRAARDRMPDLPLVRADLRALPFPSGVFVGALFVHILHLITDWQDAVREVRRALRPGAPLYVGSESGKHFASRQVYFQIIHERGLSRPHPGAANFDAVLEHLEGTGAEMTALDGGRIRWTARVRVREMLETLRRNPYSSYWHIPPDVHGALMQETERRLRRQFASLDDFEEVPARFDLWRARWPS